MKTRLKHVFSVDVEDWYQGIEKPFASWSGYEKRLEYGLHLLLDLCTEHDVKGTFFTLGWVAERYKSLVGRIASDGHEIASHGYSHEKVYNLKPEEFREEIRRSKAALEDAGGQPVTAYRAPFFSITAASLWALPILAEEGYTTDSSISPVVTWRYGIEGAPRMPYEIDGLGLVEYPPSSFRWLGKWWNIGGAYFRLLPYSLTSLGIETLGKAGESAMFYIHPWEYDTAHPKVDMDWRAKITHYSRLQKSLPNTQRLFQEFGFTTLRNILSDYAQAGTSTLPKHAFNIRPNT
jgi:polysaccharide deacetylase family protein (PEP-CTERM system associated)